MVDEIQLHLAAIDDRAFVAPELGDAATEQLAVKVEADGRDVAALRRAEDVAGAAQLEVTHGDAEAGAELVVLADRRQAAVGRADQRGVPVEEEVGVGLAVEASHAPSQLVELGEAEPVRAFDDERVAVRDVQSGLDDGRADEHVEFAGDEGGHDFLELARRHLAVAHDDARLGHERGDPFRDGLDGLDTVVQVEDLAAPGELGLHGVTDEFLVIAAHDGADGQAFPRRGFDHAEVARADEREVEGPRDRRGAHGEDVDLGAQLLEALLVAHAEAMFFVDDDEAELAEARAVGEQGVGADDDVDGAGRGARPDVGLLLGGPVATEEFDGDRPAGEALLEAFEMLLREDGRGREDRDLPAAEHALEGGAQGDLGLAEADVAADEPVHRRGAFHVGLHVDDRARLVRRLAVRERTLELAHPGVFRVLGVGDAGLGRARGLHGQQLGGEVGGGLLGGFARFLPTAAAELGELGDGPADADVAREEMRLPHGEVQHRFQGELQADEILGTSVVLVGLDAAEEADALRGVDEGVAVGEFAEVERAAHRGADGGTSTGQDGERALAAAEELPFGQEHQAFFEQPGQLARRDDHPAAEASVDDARREAADLRAGDVGVEAVDGAVGVAREEARAAVFGERGGRLQERGTRLPAVRGGADEQGLGGRGFQGHGRIADRCFVGLLQHEFIHRGGMQFRAEDIFVTTVHRDDESVGRQMSEEGRFRRGAGIITRRADHESVDLAFAALRRRVERAERLDDVAEEVDAHGHLRVQRIHVEDAAAQRVFAGLFAEGLVGVAEVFGESLGEVAQSELLALADDDLRLGRGFRRGRAAGERAGRAGDEQRPLRVMVAVAQER